MRAVTPITLTNSQSQASPSNFQQLIQTALLYPNGVRFWSPTDGYLQAWLENISSFSNIWVKIPSSIPANGAYQLYMIQDSISLSMDGVYWGEAPQLSPTYAQYDNGASVFNFYDNFAGTSLKSGWTNMGYAGTTIVNNGVTLKSISSTTTQNDQGYYYSGYTIPLNSIIEGYMSDTGNGTIKGSELGIGTSIFGGSGTRVQDYEVTPAGTTWSMEGYVNVSASTPSYISGTMIMLSSAYYSTGAAMYVNYNNVLSGTGTATTTDAYPNFGVYEDTLFLQYIRVRAYPPNGMMPTASFGTPQYSRELITVTVP